ncbi:MAG: hypothetical protein N2258_05520 [Brevinematales bacterium]|nr:hypothetical protein [Brevinematales bacterium]
MFKKVLILFLVFGIAYSQKVKEKDFIGEARAKDFQDARREVYVDVVRNALRFTIGDKEYNVNKETIEKEFLYYENVRKYIIGETEKAPKGKEKKWLKNNRDKDGFLVLRLQAYVKLDLLLRDYEFIKVKVSSIQSESFSSSPVIVVSSQQQTSSQNIEVIKVDTQLPKSSTSSQSSEDLSNVDISSITALVFYNPKAPSIVKNPEEEMYAKWAVENLNKELANIGLQTFDLETMEKLSQEREILHQAEVGNVGIGLLLAERVFAELYAEVTPTVTYQGTKAHVILNVKVFVRTTGALIANIEKGGQEYDSPSLAASIKVSMREATKKVREELIIALKRYVSRGRYYFVRIVGVDSYKQANTFVTQLQKINGVVSVKLKSGSKTDRVYDYNVQYKGNPNELIDVLLDTMSQKAGFESFDLTQVRGNELIFSLD